jgi:Tol biopolymer transport system component
MLLAGLALAGWSLLTRSPAVTAPVVRSVLRLTGEAMLQPLQVGSPLALSPDGNLLVYSGTQRLFLRRMDQLEPVPLAGTEGGAQPFFSPDGRHVGFVAGGNLKRLSLAGGPVVTLCAVQGFAGASWGEDDRIVFSAQGKLYQVAAGGGVPAPIAVQDTSTRMYRWPDVLPGGRHVLLSVGSAPVIETMVLELRNGRLTAVEGAGTNPRFVKPGFVMSFAPDGSGSAIPFDAKRARATGPAVPVLENVAIGLQGIAKLAIARNGWVTHLPASSGRRRLALVTRQGTTTLLAAEARAYSDPRFSPDGRSVAVTAIGPAGGLYGDVWLMDLVQQTLSRLTFDGRQQFPEWTPDGRRVLFVTLTGSGGLSWTAAAGGDTELLFSEPGQQIYEGIMTADQRGLVYRVGGIPGDLYGGLRDSAAKPVPLVASAFDERSPTLSPDDKWLAYASNETGRDEVYVRPFPSAGGRWLVSAAGGTEPRWRRDGRELFYRNGDSLFAVPVRTAAGFALGQRTLLFIAPFLTNHRHAAYDIHPDGQRFVFVTSDPEESGELILVQNLFANRAGRASAK